MAKISHWHGFGSELILWLNPLRDPNESAAGPYLSVKGGRPIKELLIRRCFVPLLAKLRLWSHVLVQQSQGQNDGPKRIWETGLDQKRSEEIEQNAIVALCFAVLLMSVRGGDLDCKSPFGNKVSEFLRLPFRSVVGMKIDYAGIKRG
jgi:hypothetical protein